MIWFTIGPQFYHALITKALISLGGFQGLWSALSSQALDRPLVHLKESCFYHFIIFEVTSEQVVGFFCSFPWRFLHCKVDFLCERRTLSPLWAGRSLRPPWGVPAAPSQNSKQLCLCLPDLVLVKSHFLPGKVDDGDDGSDQTCEDEEACWFQRSFSLWQQQSFLGWILTLLCGSSCNFTHQAKLISVSSNMQVWASQCGTVTPLVPILSSQHLLCCKAAGRSILLYFCICVYAYMCPLLYWLQLWWTKRNKMRFDGMRLPPSHTFSLFLATSSPSCTAHHSFLAEAC